MNVSDILKDRNRRTNTATCVCGQPAMWQVRMVEPPGTHDEAMCGICWHQAMLLHFYNPGYSPNVDDRRALEG